MAKKEIEARAHRPQYHEGPLLPPNNLQNREKIIPVPDTLSLRPPLLPEQPQPETFLGNVIKTILNR